MGCINGPCAGFVTVYIQTMCWFVAESKSAKRQSSKSLVCPFFYVVVSTLVRGYARVDVLGGGLEVGWGGLVAFICTFKHNSCIMLRYCACASTHT